MARRKRQFLEDSDSDSSPDSDHDFDTNNDPDERAERALFEDPYQRKRRKRYEEDSEDEGFGGSKEKGGRVRSNWTRAPAFVSGKGKEPTNVDQEMSMDVGESIDDEEEAEGEGENDNDSETGEYSDGSEPSRAPSPRILERSPSPYDPPTGFSGFSKGGIGSSRSTPSNSFGEGTTSGKTRTGGIGYTLSGFPQGDGGSSHRTETTSTFSPSPAVSGSFPSAFGGANTQRSFLRKTDISDSSRPSTPLSAAERAHFNKIQGTFGARLLSKMGWQPGTGLGTTGEGIVTPVESKLRPQKKGLGHGGFKEKTEQSKAEARRRGEVVSDDDDTGRKRKGGTKAENDRGKRSDAWKKPKKVKTRIEHKTYEQIVAESGQDASVPNIGQIIDATGATPREVSSLADVSLSSWTPSTDPTRMPEVRHNLRLIVESCKSNLDGLAREARALEERKMWLSHEASRLQRKVDEEAELISRLQQIQLIADNIADQAKELNSTYEASLEPFTPNFHNLYEQYSKEFDRYRLDEIVVAAIAPLVRRMVTQWQPLEKPTEFISTFRTWKRALRLTANEETPTTQLDVYGASPAVSVQIEQPMTPFESLLWNVWLPKIRSSINNEWSPQNPQPVVKLFETWSNFLPAFIRDNFLDQLVLPKVQKAVADWNPRKDKVALQTIVFPWLPHVGLRLEDVVGDARRKVKGMLRSWVVGESRPTDLVVWRDVFNSGDWDAMLLKYVVPKLGATIREDFLVNPRNQVMEPLHRVLDWSAIIRPSIFSQLLETEFFPKWLDVLHIWLIQPEVSFDEVDEWYRFWKDSFPEDVLRLNGVAQGFTRGLQLINKAIDLGPDAPTHLPRPVHHLEQPKAPTAKNGIKKARPSVRTQEITFRSIIEDVAAAHNLLFVPTARAHEKSRMPLFRVSPTADGKGGILVYILDDAVWAVEGNESKAISPEDMVQKAIVG